MTSRKAPAATRPDQHEPPSASGGTLASSLPAPAPQRFGAASGWVVPNTIELFEEPSALPVLAYSNAPPHQRVEAGPGLLDGFLRLEFASNEAILAYARRWGPLWLCEAHDLPFRHDPECQTFRDFEPVRDEELALTSLPGQERTLRWARAWYEETLVGWRDLSAQMRATLRMARRLHDGVVADDGDWGALPFLHDVLVTLIVPAFEQPLSSSDDYPNVRELEQRSGLTYDQVEKVVRQERAAGTYPEQRPPHGEGHEVFWETYRRLTEAIGRHQMQGSLAFQRQLLSEVLNYWLNLAGVRPRLEWTARNPAIELGGDGLLGALAVELLFACSQSGGLAVCTSCGTPFLPAGRRRRRDRNTYCSECGLKAAARDAAARYRKTQKYRQTYQKWFQQRRGEAT